MNLSNKDRLVLLIKYLISKPRNIKRYLNSLFIDMFLYKNTPIYLEIPWFSYESIDFLESFLKPEMKVFEYGSGGSTLFFSKRCKSVCSVEDNVKWLNLVKKNLLEKSLLNVELKSCPFDFDQTEGFCESDYLHSIGKDQYDVIIVDGQEDSFFSKRPICFKHAEKNIKSGGIIIVDDSWRYTTLRTNSIAKQVQVFESVGPCRIGVTSTDIYFY
jgi:hypothetical protein